MTSHLPSAIQCIQTPNGVLYELPRRQIGCLRFLALPMILVGIVFIGAGLYPLLIESGLADWALRRTGKPFSPFHLLLGLAFVGVGTFPIYFGWLLAGGYSTIELQDDRLIATQRHGLVCWRRTIPVSAIKRFQVKSSDISESQLAVDSALSALNVVLADGKLKNLAWGYPKTMLKALATHLTEEYVHLYGAPLLDQVDPAAMVEERTLGQNRLPETALDGDGTDHDENTIPPLPAESTIRLEEHDAGLTITIPPVGIRKGAKGLFGFAIFWNVFMAVFTALWFGSGGIKAGWELVIISGFLLVFWSVGIGTLLSSINAGRRQAILDVVGDTLLITERNLFKTRQTEIPRDNIQSIRMGPSGTEINDTPIMNLQIRLKKGKKIGVLSQLTNDELAWIAAILRHALKVPAR